MIETKKYYFIATDQKSIKIYEKKTSKLYKELRGWIGTGLNGIIITMTFDEKTELLYCSPMYSTKEFNKNDTVVVFDIKSGKIIKTIKNKKARQTSKLSINKNGKYLLAINRSEDFNIINTETNETQTYHKFLPEIKLINGKIIKKDNDYITYILDNKNILRAYSLKEERLISEEPYSNQVQFEELNLSKKEAKALDKKLFNNQNTTLKKIFYEDKKLYLSYKKEVSLFDFNKLSFSPSIDKKIKFLDVNSSKIDIIYKKNNTSVSIYDKNKSKELSSLFFLNTKVIKHLVIKNKYIVIITSDPTINYIFNLNGKAIANLDSVNSVQSELLYYKDGYLFSMGKDKIIHIWNIDKLDNIDMSKDIYDKGVLKGLTQLSKGNPLDMLKETISFEFLKQQAQANNLSFIPTEKEIKSFFKMFLLKKISIQPLASLYIKNKEWIIFNKKGIFSSSINGKKLIKYHINQGLYKEARIIKNEQIFEKFYQPMSIKRIFLKEDIETNIDIRSVLLNLQAPSVEILKYNLIDEKNLKLTYRAQLSHQKNQ